MKSDLSVLVVDDNVTRRHWILNVILGELPYTVVSVPSAYQALRWLKKLRPSAIVMGEELRRKDFQRFQAVMRKRYSDVRLPSGLLSMADRHESHVHEPRGISFSGAVHSELRGGIAGGCTKGNRESGLRSGNVQRSSRESARNVNNKLT